MTKHKHTPGTVIENQDAIPLPVEDLDEQTPPSYEHYVGVGDTKIEGVNGLRLEISGYLQILREHLSGSFPNIIAIETREELNKIGEDLDAFDAAQDQATREAMWAEISERMNIIRDFMKANWKIQRDSQVRENVGVKRSIAEPEKAKMFIPKGWNDPSKPLN